LCDIGIDEFFHFDRYFAVKIEDHQSLEKICNVELEKLLSFKICRKRYVCLIIGDMISLYVILIGVLFYFSLRIIQVIDTTLRKGGIIDFMTELNLVFC